VLGERHSFALRTSGRLARLQVLRDAREVALQAGCRKVHEGAHPGYGEPALRTKQVHRHRWILVIREHDVEFSPSHVLSDQI